MSVPDVRQAFRDRFGREPSVVASAPGRVNLIGEHTDYNGGFVFPAAIDRRIVVAAAPTDGPSEVSSRELGDGATFEAAAVQPGDVDGWTQYAAGMAWALRERFSVRNVQALVASDLPMGSGVSSSAALEVAVGQALAGVAGADIAPLDLAMAAHRCETQFVGVNCGTMDMMASALGRAGHALLIDTRSHEVVYAPLPNELVLVLCDTQTPRQLTASAYNERRSQCEAAARRLGVDSLRDATLERLFAARHDLDAVAVRRARHVITENHRVLEFAFCLEQDRTDALFDLMSASHRSLQVDYEVTNSALDLMALAAWSAEGCAGARMTGAGFGGACIALVESDAIELFLSQTSRMYHDLSGSAGSFSVLQADGGVAVEN